MKKYIALGTVTAVLIFFVMMIPQIAAGYIPSVKVTSMKTDFYNETIYAAGTIEEAEKTDVVSDFPLVFKRVNVSSGDSVQRGDVLLEVDKENTKALLLELASSGLASSAGGLTVTLLQMLADYSDEQLLALLPDTITASQSGIVTSVHVTKGVLVLPGEALVSLSDSQDVVATLAVSEVEISQIEVGQHVELTGVSTGYLTCGGKVESIASSARQQLSGTSLETVVDIVVKVDSANDFLRPGYTVKGEIQVKEPRQVNLLPYEAVGQDDNGDEYVYLYDKTTASAVKRLVESGVETENGVEIVKGVYPSDSVIFDVSGVGGEGGAISVQGRVSDSVRFGEPNALYSSFRL